MEINFVNYSCTRNETTQPAGSGEQADPKVKDSPAPEWFLLEFHSSKAFDLPKQSGLIESSLFWYHVDSMFGRRIELPRPEAGKPRMSFRIPGWRHDRDLSKDPPREIETIDELTGIKRIYIDRGSHPPDSHSLESYCSAVMEAVAGFNVQKLISGKFKPEHEAEGLAEIENQ